MTNEGIVTSPKRRPHEDSLAFNKDIYCLIWSSSRSLAPFPWPCSILPIRYLCPHHSLTHSCLNQTHSQRLLPHARRSPSFRDQRLMPPVFQSHNESNFTAFCEPW